MKNSDLPVLMCVCVCSFVFALWFCCVSTEIICLRIYFLSRKDLSPGQIKYQHCSAIVSCPLVAWPGVTHLSIHAHGLKNRR